ncbi:MAG TPA: hypothetical protein VM537_14455 [Anaerolineae bacterium]|nr:hypothetical protein [Anaerolineae bacterium]
MPDPTPSRDNLADAQAAAGPCPHHAVAKAWPMMINTIARGFAYRESETAERDARVKALEAEVSSLKELAQRYHDEAARDLEIRVKTVEVRKAQLRRHGTHTDECASRDARPGSGQPECDCGWAAIEEGLND